MRPLCPEPDIAFVLTVLELPMFFGPVASAVSVVAKHSSLKPAVSASSGDSCILLRSRADRKITPVIEAANSLMNVSVQLQRSFAVGVKAS